MSTSGSWKKLHFLSVVSLDDSWEDEDGSPFGLLDVIEDKAIDNPQNQLMQRQTVELLAEAIDTLPEKERIVVTLYYYEELNLKEIGAVLSLTESRICQLHSQAILRLRTKMKPHR
ncbi:RNA polymerase sigma factor for flagellar operon FliA [Geobacter argillaceus]|uniref:RNA polymerase sigma factor for flagellar operon FliA n=1 Tax=Geobacter argillaceus TaxID=345631 RepID=A0A562VJR4_9BACT|nr:sigma-70 family RNA polymerase sigma factor [Geobacter argillaceus]TWJ18051.1 RNA polymerase sigma factor for flagellar operon FliA [Geobacter argillaceus]